MSDTQEGPIDLNELKIQRHKNPGFLRVYYRDLKRKQRQTQR